MRQIADPALPYSHLTVHSGDYCIKMIVRAPKPASGTMPLPEKAFNIIFTIFAA